MYIDCIEEKNMYRTFMTLYFLPIKSLGSSRIWSPSQLYGWHIIQLRINSTNPTKNLTERERIEGHGDRCWLVRSLSPIHSDMGSCRSLFFLHLHLHYSRTLHPSSYRRMWIYIYIYICWGVFCCLYMLCTVLLILQKMV